MDDNKNTISDFLSPQGLIRAASKSHPAFKFAIAAAGLFALVSVILKFGASLAALAFGIVVLIAAMVIFLVFSQAAVLSRTKMRLPALVLVWSVLVLSICVAILLLSSAFFDEPLPLKSMIIDRLVLANGGADMDETPWPKKPTALFITTKDAGYGELHEHGFREALKGRGISIETAYSELAKATDDGYDAKDLERLENEIMDLLRTNEVIAVVGPCLMAITREVVDIISGGQPEVPIILESPTTRADLGNPSGEAFKQLKPPLPVYRISSGIDERIPYLAKLIYFLIKKGVPITIILEDTPYAESLNKGVLELLKRKPVFKSSDVTIVRFDRNDDLASLAPSFNDGVVFYFGTGARYIEIAGRHVEADGNVFFVGLMNAWAFGTLANKPALLHKLIDLEDIGEMETTNPRNRVQILFEYSFDRNIGPDVRDQAFSYDAGLCVSKAWDYAVQNRPKGGGYRNSLKLMREYLERDEGHEGVTGRIDFPKGGGQNMNLEAHFVLNRAELSDAKELKWVSMTAGEIVEEWSKAKDTTSEALP